MMSRIDRRRQPFSSPRLIASRNGRRKGAKEAKRSAFVVTMKWLTHLLAAVALAAQEVTGFTPFPTTKVSGGDGLQRKEKMSLCLCTGRPYNSTPGCSSSFAHKMRKLHRSAEGGAPCTAGCVFIDDVLDYKLLLHFTERHDLTLLFSSLLSPVGQSESWCAYCPTDYRSLGGIICPSIQRRKRQ